MDGVLSVATDVEKHRVAVAYDDARTDVAALRDALTKGDYPPQGEPRPLAAMPLPDPERMIVGERRPRESLMRDVPAFWTGYRDYTPRKDVVEKIAAVPG